MASCGIELLNLCIACEFRVGIKLCSSFCSVKCLAEISQVYSYYYIRGGVTKMCFNTF